MSIHEILLIVWIAVLIFDGHERRKENKQELNFLNKKIELLEEHNSLIMKNVEAERVKVKILLSAIRNNYELDKKRIEEFEHANESYKNN